MSGTKRSARRGRGYFGVAVYQPKSEVNVGTLWRTAFLYDAAWIATIGPRYRKQASDTPGTPNHIPLLNYESFQDFSTHLPYDCRIVGVELDARSKALPVYNHPTRCVYLLGAEDRGLPEAVLSKCHELVQIPSVRDWSMNLAVAGSIMLYDREAKQSSSNLVMAQASSGRLFDVTVV